MYWSDNFLQELLNMALHGIPDCFEKGFNQCWGFFYKEFPQIVNYFSLINKMNIFVPYPQYPLLYPPRECRVSPHCTARSEAQPGPGYPGRWSRVRCPRRDKTVQQRILCQSLSQHNKYLKKCENKKCSSFIH